MNLQDYITAEPGGREFRHMRTDRFTLGEVAVTVEEYEWQKDPAPETGVGEYFEKAILTLTRGERTYRCTCSDLHNWDPGVWQLRVQGRDVLCFRKTLYGFTLVDSETLTEVYDFFPEDLPQRQESFIIRGAANLGELIVFEGCYWAAPHTVMVYDHTDRRFYDTWQITGLNVLRSFVEGGDLVIEGMAEQSGEEQVIRIPESELRRRLAEAGEASM